MGCTNRRLIGIAWLLLVVSLANAAEPQALLDGRWRTVGMAALGRIMPDDFVRERVSEMEIGGGKLRLYSDGRLVEEDDLTIDATKSPMTYQRKVVFEGRVSVQNGAFEFDDKGRLRMGNRLDPGDPPPKTLNIRETDDLAVHTYERVPKDQPFPTPRAPRQEPPAAPQTPPTPPSEPPPAKNEKLRTWSSADGKFSVEAEFLSQLGNNVKLRKKADGVEITVPLDKLSAPDRDWLKNRSGR